MDRTGERGEKMRAKGRIRSMSEHSAPCYGVKYGKDLSTARIEQREGALRPRRPMDSKVKDIKFVIVPLKAGTWLPP